jgi:type III restriction enzyme
MGTWYTGKPCEPAARSHINFCVYDSTWEASEAFELDHNSAVEAWVKNDHLGFEVLYVYRGVVRKYRPDFLIRLQSGSYLVLETKGKDTEQDQTKRRFLDEWVKAVNEHGGFGFWSWDVSRDPGDIKDILSRLGQEEAPQQKISITVEIALPQADIDPHKLANLQEALGRFMYIWGSLNFTWFVAP